ncbi:hypothetical protein V5E97_09900 [Singulisphaera sp. Ch08]|uniref:Helix-turn-helix domain-containing protein n=1 Tax=Singulisphaera sp. Ch08 TaxID=3120278 RepID=A0AAU7CMV4_9BACT
MNWHSVKEAAPLIGLNVTAVYALVVSKRLGHRRLGIRKGAGKIQISDDHIAAFLESCEVAPAMEYARQGRPKDTRARGDQRPIIRPDGKPLRFS